MIFFATAHQARIFLLLLSAGLAIGLFYDFLSLFRRKSSRALAAILDIVFFLCSGALCACALAMGGEKSLRFYAILGVLCGAGIYSLGIRRVWIAIFWGLGCRLCGGNHSL